MPVRKATNSDIPQIVELAEQRRVQYQHYQPTFWRKATSSRKIHAGFLANLITREDIIMLVHENTNAIDGFIIADFVPAPPVYDPGGPTCRVDDFCTASPNLWDSVGQTLLSEVLLLAKARGAAQSVVVCGHLDEAKRSMLANGGYTIASEWYVRDL